MIWKYQSTYQLIAHLVDYSFNQFTSRLLVQLVETEVGWTTNKNILFATKSITKSINQGQLTYDKRLVYYCYKSQSGKSH